MRQIFRVAVLACLALTLNGTSSARALTQREEIELGERVAREVIRKQGPVLPANSPNVDVVRLLLEHGAKADSESLNFAISNGSDDTVRLLVEYGAEVTKIPRHLPKEIRSLMQETRAKAKARAKT